MRKSIEVLEIPHCGSLISEHVTVSLGSASIIPTRDKSAFVLLEAADRGLYKAKAEGRNRIKSFDLNIGFEIG